MLHGFFFRHHHDWLHMAAHALERSLQATAGVMLIACGVVLTVVIPPVGVAMAAAGVVLACAKFDTPA